MLLKVKLLKVHAFPRCADGAFESVLVGGGHGLNKETVTNKVPASCYEIAFKNPLTGYVVHIVCCPCRIVHFQFHRRCPSDRVECHYDRCELFTYENVSERATCCLYLELG